jgi:hypothetical protein
MITQTEIFDTLGECKTGNQLLEKINFIMTEMNTSEFQVMSAAEEAAYIIDDVFDGDLDLKNSCIQSLCESHGIAYCDENMDEINDLIVENEDELYSMIQDQEPVVSV